MAIFEAGNMSIPKLYSHSMVLRSNISSAYIMTVPIKVQHLTKECETTDRNRSSACFDCHFGSNDLRLTWFRDIRAWLSQCNDFFEFTYNLSIGMWLGGFKAPSSLSPRNTGKQPCLFFQKTAQRNNSPETYPLLLSREISSPSAWPSPSSSSSSSSSSSDLVSNWAWNMTLFLHDLHHPSAEIVVLIVFETTMWNGSFKLTYLGGQVSRTEI